jgi:hypothetical protein
MAGKESHDTRNLPAPDDGISRRQFLARGSIFAVAVAGCTSDGLAQAVPQRVPTAVGTAPQDLALVNGKIHTMDGSKRVVSQALIQNGRFTAVGSRVATRGV